MAMAQSAAEMRTARNNWRKTTTSQEKDALGTLDHSLTMKANSMYPASKSTDYTTSIERDYPDTVRDRDPNMKMKTKRALNPAAYEAATTLTDNAFRSRPERNIHIPHGLRVRHK